MEEDAMLILPLLNRTSNHLSHSTMNVMDSRKASKTEPSNTGYKQKYLKDFKKISMEDIKTLMARYSKENLLFGYSFDNETLMTSCGIRSADSGQVCC